ncbi:hypothetical protein ILYODFUR_012467 [Ilyodon furcidens]|uniref:BED-type domain-containing protein n=1 Tax=Ilyodon furcidens TaxID=33524 RepID=A0ABV0TWQ6_9TELE
MALGHSGNVSQALLLKTSDTLKAPIWQHFGFRDVADKGEPYKSKAICKTCRVEVKHCGNPNNLRNDMLRHHQEHVEAVLQQQMKLQQTLQLPANSARSQKRTETTAAFICKDMRPIQLLKMTVSGGC